MIATNVYSKASEAAAVLLETVADVPGVAVVLGSGLGGFVERLEGRVVVPYASLPHVAVTTVAGHSGNVIIGAVGSTRLIALQGRFHHYEGHDLEAATFPIRVLQRLGVTTLILTAATGGIRADLRPGDLVAVSDHINMLGANPLRGRNDDRLGPRFPDLTAVYSPRLRELAAEEAARLGIPLASGVYACMTGPSYETPAEVRMLRTLGADVVGMSTVPEAIVAKHAGMEVLAFALVTNAAAGVTGAPISHGEVLAAGREAQGRLADLIGGVLGKMNQGAAPESPAPGKCQQIRQVILAHFLHSRYRHGRAGRWGGRSSSGSSAP